MSEQDIVQNVEKIGVILYEGNRRIIKQYIGKGFTSTLDGYQQHWRLESKRLPDSIDPDTIIDKLYTIISQSVQTAKLIKPSDKTHVVGQMIFDEGVTAIEDYFGFRRDYLKEQLSAEILNYDGFLGRLTSERKHALDEQLRRKAVGIVALMIRDTTALVAGTADTKELEKKIAQTTEFFDRSQEMYLTPYPLTWTDKARNKIRPETVVEIIEYVVNGKFSRSMLSQYGRYVAWGEPELKLVQAHETDSDKAAKNLKKKGGGHQRKSAGGIILPD